MQVGKQKPGALFEGRSTSNPMCEGRVSSCLFTINAVNLTTSFNTRIDKMNENCLKEFTAHWTCLEKNNQVGYHVLLRSRWGTDIRQEYYACRKVERTLNNCVFQKLVRFFIFNDLQPVLIL